MRRINVSVSLKVHNDNNIVKDNVTAVYDVGSSIYIVDLLFLLEFLQSVSYQCMLFIQC